MDTNLLLGLVGALIGAISSLIVSVVSHKLTQRRAEDQARSDAAAKFLARVQGIRTEYQMLDLALDVLGIEKIVTTKCTYRSGSAHELCEDLFRRGLDAWAWYRQAEGNLTANSKKSIKMAADDLHKEMDSWVNYVDARYFELDLRHYEGVEQLEVEDDRVPTLRHKNFLDQLERFENKLRRSQGLPQVEGRSKRFKQGLANPSVDHPDKTDNG